VISFTGSAPAHAEMNIMANNVETHFMERLYLDSLGSRKVIILLAQLIARIDSVLSVMELAVSVPTLSIAIE
jgi:hypothetical protein